MPLIKMYTTGVCPFCTKAKNFLNAKGAGQIEEIRVDTDPAQRNKMIALTGRRTVPQIFIGEQHIGGCDDLIALDSQGGLLPLLQGS